MLVVVWTSIGDTHLHIVVKVVTGEVVLAVDPSVVVIREVCVDGGKSVHLKNL